MKALFTPRFLFVVSAIAIAALSRLVPHVDNVTPVFAIALFGGATLSDKRMAFIIPLLAMFISDCIIGFHSTLIYVYVSFVLISAIGLIIRSNVKPHTVVIASLVSSTLFFLISNFGYWAQINFAGGFAGLLKVYMDGLPFFRTPLLGDLVFNTVLFGGFYLASLKFPKLAKL